jgi:hypothetical protein
MKEAAASTALLSQENSVSFGKEFFLQIKVFKVKKSHFFSNPPIQLS